MLLLPRSLELSQRDPQVLELLLAGQQFLWLPLHHAPLALAGSQTPLEVRPLPHVSLRDLLRLVELHRISFLGLLLVALGQLRLHPLEELAAHSAHWSAGWFGLFLAAAAVELIDDMLVLEFGLDGILLPLGRQFRVFLLFRLANLENDQQMEGAADILTPMQEQFIHNPGEYVVVERISELQAEKGVESVEDGQHFLQQVGVLGVEDGLDCCEEVVVVEVVGEQFVGCEGCEVALQEVEALDDAVGLEEVRLGEDEHHEGAQQLLVAHQLHVAAPHLRAHLHQPTAGHLAQEYRKQLPVSREVLPQRPSSVAQELLALVPQLRVNAVEELLVVAVEQQHCPLRVPPPQLAQLLKGSHKFALLPHQRQHRSLPVVEVALRRAFQRVAGPDLCQFLLGERLVGGPGETSDELVLAPGKAEVGIGDEAVDADQLLEVDAIGCELDDLAQHQQDEQVELLGESQAVLLVPDAAEVLEPEDGLPDEAVDEAPEVLVGHLLLGGQALGQQQQQLQQAVLRSEQLVSDREVFLLQIKEHLLQKQVEVVFAHPLPPYLLQVSNVSTQQLHAQLLSAGHRGSLGLCLAGSVQHNTFLAQDNAFHLFCVQPRLQELQLQPESTSSVSEGNFLLYPAGAFLEGHSLDADALEAILELQLRVGQQQLENALLSCLLSHLDPHHCILELAAADCHLPQRHLLDLLVLLEHLAGLHRRAAIRQLNERTNTIREREKLRSALTAWAHSASQLSSEMRVRNTWSTCKSNSNREPSYCTRWSCLTGPLKSWSTSRRSTQQLLPFRPCSETSSCRSLRLCREDQSWAEQLRQDQVEG